MKFAMLNNHLLLGCMNVIGVSPDLKADRIIFM
jgi:hypothetical protein